MKERPDHASWVTDAEKAYIKAELEKEEQQKQAVKKYTTWQALKDPKVLRLALIYFLWVIGFWGFSFWMPQVLKSLSGLATKCGSLVYRYPNDGSLTCTSILWSFLWEAQWKRWHIATTLFIGTFGFIATPHSPSPEVSLFFICLTAVGVYGGMGVWWTMPTTFLSGAAAAGAMGLINSSGNMGGWVGPYMLGIHQWSHW